MFKTSSSTNQANSSQFQGAPVSFGSTPSQKPTFQTKSYEELNLPKMGPFSDIKASDHYHFTQIIVDNRSTMLNKDQRKGVPIYAKTAEKSVVDPANNKIHSSVVHLKLAGYE